MMKLTAAGVAQIVAAAVAGAVSAVGVQAARPTPQTVLEQLATDVAAIKADVRLLKCAAQFPGDCPGQAVVKSGAR